VSSSSGKGHRLEHFCEESYCARTGVLETGITNGMKGESGHGTNGKSQMVGLGIVQRKDSFVRDIFFPQAADDLSVIRLPGRDDATNDAFRFRSSMHTKYSNAKRVYRMRAQNCKRVSWCNMLYTCSLRL
jgi:hypothetical protein